MMYPVAEFKQLGTAVNPPWIFRPNWPRGSMGWKMGGGEDYYDNFYHWFSRLNEASRNELMSQFPEPEDWKGFYEMIIDHPWI